MRALADPGEAVGLLAAQVSPGVTGVRTALVPYVLIVDTQATGNINYILQDLDIVTGA